MNSEDAKEIKEEQEEVRRGFFFTFMRVIFSGALLPLLASIFAALTLSGVVFDNFNLVISKPNNDVKADYFIYLKNGLQESKFDEQYFETGFSYFNRKSNGQLTTYGKTETLEDFFVYLNTLEADKAMQPGAIEQVTKLLDESRNTEPFAALPPEERRLMEQLQIQLSSVEDELTLRTMNELKQVLLARNKEYTKIEEQNAWSLPLSIIGVFLTLVFGVWSTILSIKQSKPRLLRATIGRAEKAF